MTIYAVTNTVNLARVISFGCLGPKTLYGEKYLRDACALTSGALPLFAGVPPASALQTVDGPGVTPVLVELAEGCFSDSGDTVVTGSLIPASLIRQVHFRNEAESREYLTTPFENVDPNLFAVEVSPELFRSTAKSTADSGEPVHNEGSEPSLFDDLPGDDAGPSAAATPLVDGATISLIDRRLGGLAEISRPVTPSQSSVTLAASVLSSGLRSVTEDPVIASGAVVGLEAEAHAVICEVLLAAAPSDRATAVVLDALDDQLDAKFSDSLREIRQILRGRLELTRSVGSSGAVLTGLVLALISDTPQGIRNRSRGESGADDLAEMLALWYAGFRRGLARRPTSERIEGLERDLQFAAARSGAAANPPAIPDPPAEVEATSRITDGAYQYLLTGGLAFVAGVQPFASPIDRLTAALDSADVIVGVAEFLKVPITSTIEVSGTVAIDSVDGGVRVTIESPHRIRRSATRELVEAALSELDVKRLQLLADELAPVSGEAP